MFPKRWLVCGLDSATPEFLSSSECPFLQQVWTGGISGTLRSTTPPLTPIAWTTIMSGKPPREHGIYGFRKFDGGIFSSADVHVPRLWDMVKPSHSLFFPLVYPVPLRSADNGFVCTTAIVHSDESRHSSHQDLSGPIAEASIHPDPTDIDGLLSALRAKLAIWERVVADDNFPWIISAAMLPECDSVMHFHWDRQPEVFSIIDDTVARLFASVGDVGIVLVSDHGSTRVKWDFDPEAWVENRLSEDEQKRVKIDGWGNIWCGGDHDLCQKVKHGLCAVKYGGKWILDVWEGSVLFGDVKDAPDLVVWPRRELGYSQQPKSGAMLSAAVKQGCHLPDGIVAFWWPGVEPRRVEGEAVDFVPTMLQALGYDVSSMYGRALF